MDALGTNEAAAKTLLSLSSGFKSKFPNLRYFLLVGKCGTHQAGLSAKNGVLGRAAAAAAHAAGEGKEYEGVTENAVRLFKYLVPEYYEDFVSSIALWVDRTIAFLSPHCVAAVPGSPLQVTLS